MVVDDLDVMDRVACPAEADAPLIVDSNRVLFRSFTFQFFEAIARRREEVAEAFGFIEIDQLPPRRVLDCWRKMARHLAFGDFFGFSAGEADDHRTILSRGVIMMQPGV